MGRSVHFFGILGLQIWQGIFHNRCYKRNSYDTLVQYGLSDQLCSQGPIPGGYTCPNNTMCLKKDAPSPLFNGLGGFDNFGYSVLTIFILVGIEHWSYIVANVTDAGGLCWPFF